MPVVLPRPFRALLVAGLLALGACAGTDEPRADPRQAAGPASMARPRTDDFGLEIPAGREFTRVVSLEPAVTEIVFAIGGGSRLIGRSRYDLYPDSALRIPVAGEGIRPNVEALIALRPDLVLLYAANDNRAVAERLRTLGIAAVGFRSDRIADFSRVTLELGRLLGDTARAAVVRDSVQRTLHRVARATAGRPRPTVVMPVWHSPLYVIGGGSFMSELVAIAGGRNVYDSTAAPSPQVSFEDVLRRDPAVVLVGPAGRARLLRDATWRVLPAVGRGRVVAYDTLVTGRPGVRLGEAAVSLARLLHPDLALDHR